MSRRVPYPCCLAVGLAVHDLTLNPLVTTAEVHEVEALAERARHAFQMDAYAMAVSVMFAQVLAPAVTNLDVAGRWAKTNLPPFPCEATPRAAIRLRLALRANRGEPAVTNLDVAGRRAEANPPPGSLRSHSSRRDPDSTGTPR